MPQHEFTMVLDRTPAAEDDFDRIFEAGLDDATVESNRLDVTREATDLLGAITTAVNEARAAGFHVIALDTQDLVTLDMIAKRTARTYESIRLLATGRRGPGGFPEPLSAGGYRLYSWIRVGQWFRESLGEKISDNEYDRIISMADHVLRARSIATQNQWNQISEFSEKLAA